MIIATFEIRGCIECPFIYLKDTGYFTCDMKSEKIKDKTICKMDDVKTITETYPDWCPLINSDDLN